jgi:hypothetical protein
MRSVKIDKPTVLLYHSIDEKEVLERKLFTPLTPEESVKRTLDLMDLMCVLRENKTSDNEENLPWIVLEINHR